MLTTKARGAGIFIIVVFHTKKIVYCIRIVHLASHGSENRKLLAGGVDWHL